MIQLTIREWVVLTFITQYIRDHKRAPTLREIAKGTGWRSADIPCRVVCELEACGVLESTAGKLRTTRLLSCVVGVQP